jgi:hypothetical protein
MLELSIFPSQKVSGVQSISKNKPKVKFMFAEIASCPHPFEEW